MKNEKETKTKLLASAKKEFLAKGYMQASLRCICQNAGVTTGALYFFFQDKEDLFGALVEEPLNKLYEVLNQHFSEEIQQVEMRLCINEMNYDEMDYSLDVMAAQQIVHYMYQYYDEFQLILTKSQGSRFEKCIEKFVEILEKHYGYLAEKMIRQKKSPSLDPYMMHWLSHMMVDSFVHVLTYEKSEEKAMKHIEIITKFIVTGWFELFS